MDNFFTEVSKYFQIDTAVMYYYGGITIKIIIIFVLSKLAIAVLNRVIINIFKLYPRFKIDDKKSGTLVGILKSVIKYVVYIIMGISILETLNIPTQSILATAGLGGLAIGFGAQSLVRDVFTGFFILFEDQYGVGDYVTINGVTGTVEDIGLRITRIRSFNGELHIIPNGEIKAVTNASRGNSLAIIDISVAYESDQEKALGVLTEIALAYYENNKDKAAEKPEVLGIIRLGESDVIIRTIIKTRPLMHWNVERELRKLILDAFKKEKIEIPYPKRVMVQSK
ncbi:MAG TPA: mechanosensitive ion channel family protein [Patescibacteria group bacterium]|nr:mechanosensitive ion channel family protein [Patescibacteria group bacterium]